MFAFDPTNETKHENIFQINTQRKQLVEDQYIKQGHVILKILFCYMDLSKMLTLKENTLEHLVVGKIMIFSLKWKQ